MASASEPLRVGLYVRISKDSIGDGSGVARQEEDGRRLIAFRGYHLHRVYRDNDISAAGRKRRPDYQQLLRDLDAGVIDGVVARSFERLCKSRREQLTFVELGQERRATVAFTHAPDLDLTSAIGRGMADIMAANGRIEMELKSERHRDQIAQAARAGRMVGARRAFGYRDGGLEPDPVEAEILRGLYGRFLAGESLGSLARDLNAAGVGTPRGHVWRSQTVREVLANPRNAGLRGMRPVVNERTGTRSQWHEIVGPAVWPGVVPEDTWRAVMRLIRDPARPGNHVGENRQRYLLTGIAECGVCGRPLIVGGQKIDVSRTTGGRTRYRVLRCPSLRHVNRRADRIEAFVEGEVIGYFSGPARHLLAPPPAPVTDLAAVRAERAAVRAALDNLAADYADGVLDREQVRVASERHRARLAALDDTVAAAGAVDVTAELRAAENPETVWGSYPLERRRAVLRRIATIRVLPGSPGRPGGRRFDPGSVDVVFRD